MPSVAEALPKEQARCRELLLQYKEIGPAGAFGALFIEQKLREADNALASGDVVRIVKAYDALTKCE